MVKNTAQFQGGLSLPRSPATCGTEEQRRLALFTMRRPQGFRCPKCGHKHCSALQSRKLYRCRHCRFQVSETQGAIFASIKVRIPRHPASDSTRRRPRIPRDPGRLFQ